MNYQRAMIEADKTAKETNHLMFLYWTGKDWLITNRYEKGWLFRAWPGGRKELSLAGKELLERVEKAGGNQ